MANTSTSAATITKHIDGAIEQRRDSVKGVDHPLNATYLDGLTATELANQAAATAAASVPTFEYVNGYLMITDK